MQPQRVLAVDHFRNTFVLFEQTMQWLRAETGSTTHCQMERALRDRGFELMRVMYQGWLEQRSLEERRQAAGENHEPGLEVRSFGRNLECDFGRVRLSRLGYQRAGQATEFPLDRELSLPDESYSLEVRHRVAFEAQRGSWDEVVSTVDRNSGAHVPKRQAQQLAKRAAQDLEAFYQQSAGSDNDVLSPSALEVASCDSKGVTMLKKGLREATRKAAEQAQSQAQTKRADPMATKKQRKHDKRMAIVTANWEQERQPRTAEQILANLDRQPDAKKPRGPRPQNKRVCASIQKSQAQGISEMFDEIERRDRQRQRTTVVLVDGEENQLEQVQQQAESRRLTLKIILDLIHVIHYLWIGAYVLCGKDAVSTEAQVRELLGRLLTGPANYIAASMRRQATLMNLTAAEREPVDKCCDYLLKYQDYMHYNEYLAEGLPIATGVIEGACRHLVEDRMGITGARWDVPGAEAVLRLRAIRCSGDWDEYWQFHERQELERNHGSMAA
jgi:hypothetical protein